MGISRIDAKLCKERNNYTCQCCGFGGSEHYSVFLQIDHIVPRYEGGEDCLENYQTLCMFCNRVKSAVNIYFGDDMEPQLPLVWAENQRLFKICIGGMHKKDMTPDEQDEMIEKFFSLQISGA